MIRKISKSSKVFYIVFLVNLLLSSCSKMAHIEKPAYGTITAPENKKLNAFLKTGAEKKLDVSNVKIDDIISISKNYLGVPHCMGGKSAKCTDCSGLLVMVFEKYGVQLPHDSEEQARYGKIIYNKTDLKAGDLIFFIKSYKTNKFITHSGIYLGNNEFIHASSSKGVVITSLDDTWWAEKFIFGTRLFNN